MNPVDELALDQAARHAIKAATEALNAASVLRDFADEVLTPPEADPFDACRGLTDEERDAYRAPVPAPVDGERHRV